MVVCVELPRRFVRKYGTEPAGDWLISDVYEFQVRELKTSKGSDQDSQ